MKLKFSKISFMDCIWLIYFIINYTFSVLINKAQMLSTISLFLIIFIYPIIKERKLYIQFPKINGLFWWFGAFTIFSSLSYFWSYKEGIAYSNVFNPLIQIVVLFLCFDCYITTDERLNSIIKWFTYAISFFAIVILFTSPLSTWMTLDFGSATGVHRNTIGYSQLFGCLLALFNFSKTKLKRYIFIAMLCLPVSILTGSRKIVVGYIIAGLIYLATKIKSKKILKRVSIIILVMTGVFVIVYQFPTISQIIDLNVSRLLALVFSSVEDTSVDVREMGRKLATHLFLQSPIIGNGWNAVSSQFASYWSKTYTIYAHNNFLEVLADFGIFGFILFYWKYVYEIIKAIPKIMNDSAIKFAFVSLIVVVILDWGQVTYYFLPMMIIQAILFKIIMIAYKKY